MRVSLATAASEELIQLVADGLCDLADADRLRLEDLVEEDFIDFPAGTPGRAQSDEAFTASGLRRTVAFEVIDTHLIGCLVRERFGLALLPSGFAPQLPDLVAIPVTDAPSRTEHVVWNHPSPAAAAFLEQLDIPVGEE